MDTNLNESQAEDLKTELDFLLQQTNLHNPFIDANHGSCFNPKSSRRHQQNGQNGGNELESFSPSYKLCPQHLLSTITTTP